MQSLRWPAGTSWVCGLLLPWLCAAGVQAATITVDTAGDGGTGCTLRRAVGNVNAAGQVYPE